MSVEFYRESPGKFDSRAVNKKALNRWTGRNANQFDNNISNSNSNRKVFPQTISYTTDIQIAIITHATNT